VLQGENLVKSYGARVVLRRVSLTVQSAGLSVLIGPSGCGKSTLLRALSLLEPPDAGRISLDSTSLEFPHARVPRDLRPWPTVTVVFQQHFLWPHLTLRSNILLPIRRAHDREERMATLVAAFGLETVLDRYPNEVSLGQRQRAALVRGLALRPRYILLDEITSALDVEQSAKILRFFLDGGARETGLLIVTHLLGFARRLMSLRDGGMVYFMDQGSIVETGSAEILSAPLTSRLRSFLKAEALVT